MQNYRTLKAISFRVFKAKLVDTLHIYREKQKRRHVIRFLKLYRISCEIFCSHLKCKVRTKKLFLDEKLGKTLKWETICICHERKKIKFLL